MPPPSHGYPSSQLSSAFLHSFLPLSAVWPCPLLSWALLQGSLEDDRDKSEGRLLHLWRGLPGARRGTTLPPEALCPSHPEPIFAKMQTSQALLAQQERICLQYRRPGFDPWVWKIPWRRKWQPTPVILPGKSQGQRSLEGYSPWGHSGHDGVTKQKQVRGASLVVQWVRLYASSAEVRVRSLVRELDPTGHS